MAVARAGAFLIVVVATLTSGCVTTRFTLVNPAAEPFPPVPPDSVLILTDEAELDTLEYSRVAIIEATGSGEWTNQTQMIEAMRKRAGAIGANAILLPQINEPGAGAKVAGAIFGTGTQRKGNVVALRILGLKEPSGPDRAAGFLSSIVPKPRARTSSGPARSSYRARLRRIFGLEEGSPVIAEETPEGILIRPAVTVPVEVWSPERKRSSCFQA